MKPKKQTNLKTSKPPLRQVDAIVRRVYGKEKYNLADSACSFAKGWMRHASRESAAQQSCIFEGRPNDKLLYWYVYRNA